MSWSVDFKAANRAIAKRHVLADNNLPILVRALIVDAIDHTGDDKPIHVKGHGHQAESSGSYDVSSCTLQVEPLSIRGS